MPTGVETAIQGDLRDILRALGLANMRPDNVGKIREQPKVTEVIDSLPCVLICQRDPLPPESLGFEGGLSRGYVEEIIVIAGREGDSETDQTQTQLWQEQCINAIAKNNDGSWRLKLPTASSVYDLRVGDVAGIDRTKLSENYAYLSFFVTARSAE